MTEAQVYDFSTSLEDQVQGITHRTEPSLKAALLCRAPRPASSPEMSVYISGRL